MNIDPQAAFRAVESDDLATLKELVDRSPDLLHARDEYGRQLIHLAGTAELVDFLLDAGCDIETRSRYGWTPLHHASYMWRLGPVERLIQRGADVNARGTGSSAHGENTANEDTPLILAVDDEKYEMAELLLIAGADTEIADSDGWTPLHYAVLLASYPLAILLIDYGASANAQTNEGNTPLHLAAQGEMPEIIALFIDHGGDINVRNGDGETPAEVTGSQAIRKMLRG